MLGYVIMGVLATFFYGAANYEDLDHPVAWGAASAVLFIAGSSWLDFGLLGCLALQFALFVLMGVWIAKEKKRSTFTKMPRP